MPHEFSSTIRQHGSLPWDVYTVLGGGYDMATRESLPSPFESVEVEDSYAADIFPLVDVQAQVFRDEQELTDQLWSMAAASSSHLSIAAVKDMASYIKTTKCNSENVCLILRCTLSMPPQHFDEELDLTEQGRHLLNSDAKKFTECYGEYYVAGQIRQSSFFAVCTYSSANTTELDKLTAALGTMGGDKTGLEAATELVKATETRASSILESHRFNVLGVEGDIGLSWLENATVTEAWEGFRDDYKPVPQIAILKHYSSILPERIARPVSHHEISWEVAEALWKCALLQMASRSQATKDTAQIAALDKLGERLSWLSKSVDAASVTEAKDILAKLNNRRKKPARSVKAELTALKEKDQLLCVEDEWSHGTGVWASCGKDTWEFGISPSRAADLGISASSIQSDSKTCQLPDTGSLITQKPDPIRHEVPGRVIIGAKLRNRYSDPHDGGKWKRVGSWLGTETFSIKVETRHTRGCDWELTVWSIPRSIFEEGGDA